MCVVQEQASWVCQCEEGVVQRLEQDFKATLQQQSSLEQWAVWLDNVVSQVLKPYEDKQSFPKAARQFLLKWSFYRQAQAPLCSSIVLLRQFFCCDGVSLWVPKANLIEHNIWGL